MKRILLLTLSSGIFISEVMGQCNYLRQQRNITFDTDKDCAPVTVTDFTITYFFNVPQDPADIVIRFEWNDPTASFDEVSNADGLITGGGGTEFTATGTFTYPANEQCLFEPKAYIIVDGILCETSEQPQLVSSWSDDNNYGGELAITPPEYEVCYDNPVNAAVFTDNSTFNCNRQQDPDNPNELDRYTQFVYGTNHNPANSIRNLTLDDGGAVNLTDGTGALAGTTTRGGVTAAYFGPIENIPFPAMGPNMQSFPISAPADPANAVGSEFEITLYNWNACNPYNGDPANPNYGDAVSTTAYIRIIAPPDPDFQTRLDNAGGNIQTTFCIGDNIYFDNLTAGGYAYTWEFFDDNTGTVSLGTSTDANPVFVYTSPGQKLIRLTADDPNAQGDCEVMVEKIIEISPNAMAAIELYDAAFGNQITPKFCQDGGQVFTIGLRDATTDIEPDTEWRWEFYDENGMLEESVPAGAGYGAQYTDFTRTYTRPGVYLVRLIARNNGTQCVTVDEKEVVVYTAPTSVFDFDEVCEGERTPFRSISDSLASLSPRVNDDHIATYEWDFSYDGTFNPELTLNNNDDFEWYLDGQNVTGSTEPATSAAGTYQVALRVTTSKGACSALMVQNVPVHPLPVPVLTSSYTDPICPEEEVTFFNGSDLSGSTHYTLLLDDGTGTDTLVFNQPDSTVFFTNDTDSLKSYNVLLLAETPEGCTSQSGTIRVDVYPSSPSGFADLNYDEVGSNCSVWSSTLQVDAETQALDPDVYTWTISDQNGVLDGYPVTKNKGDAAFHQLDYTIENTSGTNQVYQIRLEVTKPGICIDPSELSIVVNPEPSAAFTVAAADSCGYRIFTLEAVQKGLASYEWTFDPVPDQYVNDDDIQTLLYNRPTAGSADLEVSFSLVTGNLANCNSAQAEEQGSVTAGEEDILVDFDVDPDTLILPDNTITIANNSNEGAGWSYSWDFGDGFVSDARHPGSHQYADAGEYPVTLTVSNTFCKESLTKTVVIAPTDPVVEFEADVTEGCRPLTVTFTNHTRYADPSAYLWDFGDGSTSREVHPVHTYSKSGTYTVSLYAENAAGAGKELIREDFIEVYTSPLADFAINPTTVFIPGQEVYFRNLSRDATYYKWDFGDGGTSEEENPVHAYTEEGDYDIALIAASGQGCADTLLLPAAISAVKGGMIRSPNAFSPSLDGPTGGHVSPGGAGTAMNDVFMPKVEGVTEFRMLIYNKWGQLLFESNSLDIGWDGYYQGKLMPMDVYVVRLELTFADGRRSVQIGDVTLVR